jgi:hypothetical protein
MFIQIILREDDVSFHEISLIDLLYVLIVEAESPDLVQHRLWYLFFCNSRLIFTAGNK